MDYFKTNCEEKNPTNERKKRSVVFVFEFCSHTMPVLLPWLQETDKELSEV